MICGAIITVEPRAGFSDPPIATVHIVDLACSIHIDVYGYDEHWIVCTSNDTRFVFPVSELVHLLHESGYGNPIDPNIREALDLADEIADGRFDLEALK